LTVVPLTTSSAAISPLERPRAMSEDLSSRGEVVDPGRGRRRRDRLVVGELLDQAARDGRRQERLAGRDQAHAVGEPLRRGVLSRKRWRRRAARRRHTR